MAEREEPIFAKQKLAAPAPIEATPVPPEVLSAPPEAAPLLAEGLPHEAPSEPLPKLPEDQAATPVATRLIYFVSSVLRAAHEWYPMQQKLLLALLIASRKLRHYF